MIDRLTIRASAVDALTDTTAAGGNVFSPRDWPTMTGSYPVIIVRTPHERKDASNPRYGPPEFNSTIMLVAVGTVESTTEGDAEEQLEALSSEIEIAILTNGKFLYDNEIQQVTSVETSMEVKAEGERHIGTTVVVFRLEVHQLFEPALDAVGSYIGRPLDEVDITIKDGATGKTLTGIDIQLT